MSRTEKLQTDLDKLGEWAVENEAKRKPNRSEAISFTKARLRNQNIPDANFCNYLRIIIRGDLSWVQQVDYTVQKAWRALHFVMCIVKRGNIFFIFYYCIFTIYSRYIKTVISKRDGCEYLNQVPSIDGSLELI
jgi:hypothetical protein